MEGTHTLRVCVVNGGFSLDAITFDEEQEYDTVCNIDRT